MEATDWSAALLRVYDTFGLASTTHGHEKLPLTIAVLNAG